MIRNFTHFGHCVLACLLFSLITLTGFSKAYNNKIQEPVAHPFGDANLMGAYTVFEAHLSKNFSVALNWSKETINTTNYFEVERSFDLVEFKTVALIMTPDADFVTDGSFNFRDNSKALAGKKQAWYRIKEIDADGKFNYSDVKQVILAPTTLQVSLYPNPFVESLKVKFDNKLQGNAEIRLLSFSGDVISSKKSVLVKGVNSIELEDLSSASNGIYIVEISVNGTVTERQKVIKK